MKMFKILFLKVIPVICVITLIAIGTFFVGKNYGVIGNYVRTKDSKVIARIELTAFNKAIYFDGKSTYDGKWQLKLEIHTNEFGEKYNKYILDLRYTVDSNQPFESQRLFTCKDNSLYLNSDTSYILERI